MWRLRLVTLTVIFVFLLLSPAKESYAVLPLPPDSLQVGGLPGERIRLATCYPGSGWRWTTGPAQPEIAAQVEQGLSQIGIEAQVAAWGYGETDSCGTFKLSGIDFTLTVKSTEQISKAHQQQLVGHLVCLLPFLEQCWATGHRASGASARAAQSMSALARPLAARGTLPAPFKGCWVLVPSRSRIFQRRDDRLWGRGILPGQGAAAQNALQRLGHIEPGPTEGGV